MARNRVIGRDNRLPWKLPADLRHFRRVTMGKPVVMGRKTFESIGKPLDGRINIVITHDRTYSAPGCRVVHSVDDALQADAGEIMVIGGANLYRQTIPVANRIYLTLIDADLEGDAMFPPLDMSAWRETERMDYEPDARNPYRYSFLVLQRRP